MTPPTFTRPTGTRRSADALLTAADRVPACTLPALGGLAFGTVLDRVFDASARFAGLAAVGAAIVIAVVRRRRIGGPDGC
ncbi:MAG: hypothetical protein ACRELA_06345 [Candidatus Rokuibacteriota bacterium]